MTILECNSTRKALNKTAFPVSPTGGAVCNSTFFQRSAATETIKDFKDLPSSRFQ